VARLREKGLSLRSYGKKTDVQLPADARPRQGTVTKQPANISAAEQRAPGRRIEVGGPYTNHTRLVSIYSVASDAAFERLPILRPQCRGAAKPQ
jgi:hypothetical protein